MISKANFNISIAEAVKLLKAVKIFKAEGPKRGDDFSSMYKKTSLGGKHIDIYNLIRDNLDYNIILSDDSFFQFSQSDNYLRFAFIQNPTIPASKYDFLRILFPDEEISNLDELEVNDLINEEEYEQFLSEQDIHANLIYIRYDFDKKGYKPLIHSCSHLHIGLSDNLRIPLAIVLYPLEFVSFCVKQCYYSEWVSHQSRISFEAFLNSRRISKKQCVAINDSSTWHPDETNELYII